MADSETGVIVFQGALIKSPPEHKSKDLSRWRKRYFRLWSTRKLEYFKHEKSEKPLKKPIDLSECKGIDGKLKNKKWENIFCLNMGYRKYFLVAKSADLMEEWIKKLCELCGFAELDETETIEVKPKLGIQQSPLSPSYRKSFDPGMAATLDSPSTEAQTEDARNDPTNLPNYDKDLPPIPDSSSSDSFDELEPTRTESPPPVIGSPYASGIKQSRSNVYSSEFCASYDLVPAPRCVPEDSISSAGFPQRRLSTPTTAMSKMTANDESYVDMQQGNGVFYDAVPKPSATLRDRPSSYDLVPPPRLAKQVGQQRYGNYDLVPTPVPKSDEYIPCEIMTCEAAPPVTATERKFEFRSANSCRRSVSPYNSPPGYSSGLASSAPLSSPTIFNDYHSSPPTNRSFPQDVYDTHPSSRDYPCQDIYDTPPISRDYPSQDIYDTPPVSRDLPPQDIYDTPPISRDLPPQDIYDTPPISRDYPCQDIYDTPPISQDLPPQDIYDTPPISRDVPSQDIYDTPPISRDVPPQDIYDMPPIPRRGDEPNVKDKMADTCYDFPPQTDFRNGQKDLIYDRPPTSREFSDHGSLYDVPPISQIHGGTMIDDGQTSPADLFNFGFSSAPPRVDRSLKYASTGGMDSSNKMISPPLIDRSTRPNPRKSVPVFPSEVARRLKELDMHGDCGNDAR